MATPLHRIPRALARLASSALLLGPLICASEGADVSLEYKVKAAFILNFTKFIDWPPTAFADSNAPLTICVWGPDPFGSELVDVVKGEVIHGRELIVRRINKPPAAQSCQVVFFGMAEKDLPALTSPGAGMLTIGEGAGFLREGGIIAFIIDNHRVRFDISQSVADRAGLKLSSKLLSVARSVQ